MNEQLSRNAQAILLLTAPLIVGRRDGKGVKPLSPGEYNRLARQLRDAGREPADLLGDDAGLIAASGIDRLGELLARGFQLAQALERWRTRAMWVVSRADADYPVRLKRRLKEQAPPVLYGCGDRTRLNAGGLAVVGSRDAPAPVIEWTENVGKLAAEAGRAIVSGGALGVDQAAMRGALNAGGAALGILPSELQRAVTRRENRDALMDDRLVLISADDPAARFQGWRAMARNRLIYALADAALVATSAVGKGGTWTGAVEELERAQAPVYVRAGDNAASALIERGAREWPEPDSPAALAALLDQPSPAPAPATLLPRN